jgi:Beta-eliminating lyase
VPAASNGARAWCASGPRPARSCRCRRAGWRSGSCSARSCAGKVSVSNTYSAGTRAAVEAAGAEAVDPPVPVPDGMPNPFGGDIDLDALADLLTGPTGSRIRCVVLTITNDANGGQPVSHLAGLPVLQPGGCHAVSVDAGLLRAHLPPLRLPATTLATELYLAGGVRSGGRGTQRLGKHAPDGGPDLPAPSELVRFAMAPARVHGTPSGLRGGRGRAVGGESGAAAGISRRPALRDGAAVHRGSRTRGIASAAATY